MSPPVLPTLVIIPGHCFVAVRMPQSGKLLSVETTGIRQTGEVVVTFRRTNLVRRKVAPSAESQANRT